MTLLTLPAISASHSLFFSPYHRCAKLPDKVAVTHKEFVAAIRPAGDGTAGLTACSYFVLLHAQRFVKGRDFSAKVSYGSAWCDHSAGRNDPDTGFLRIDISGWPGSVSSDPTWMETAAQEG